MPEETPETTPETPEAASDKEMNFEALRKQLAESQQEIARLRQSEIREKLRDAGIDPATPQGKIAVKDLTAGAFKVEDGSDFKASVVDYLHNEYGFDKPKAQLSETETAQVSGSERLNRLSQSASSVDPGETVEDQINALYAQAAEATDPSEAAVLRDRARQMKNAYHARRMLSQSG